MPLKTGLWEMAEPDLNSFAVIVTVIPKLKMCATDDILYLTYDAQQI